MNPFKKTQWHKKLIVSIDHFFMIVMGIICFLLIWAYEAAIVAPRNVWDRHWPEWRQQW